MRDRIILFSAAVVVFLVLAGNVTTSFEVDETKTVSASSEVNVSGSYKNQNNLNDSKIYLNNKTGAPHRVFANGAKIGGFENIRGTGTLKEKDRRDTESDIVKITDNFILNNRHVLNVKPEDLKLEKIDLDNENYYINYQQHYQGIPVYQSFVGLTVDFEDRVLLLGSDFHPDINVSVIPLIHKKELIEYVNNYDLGSEIMDFSLVIFPEEKDDNFIYHLAWMVSSSGNGSRVFFVDAHTGELIYYYNAIRNLNGTVTGMIYPEHPLQSQVEAKFPHEFVYVNETRNDSSVFYSNSGNNLNNYMVTKVKINLTNISSANLSFATRYDIEQGWDFAYVEVSKNGTVWEQLNSTGMSSYANPEAYAAGWVPGAPAYTGNSIGWINETISLNEYINNSIFLRFRYTTDAALIKDGIYFDDVKVVTDNGVIFFDNAENGSIKWNFSGFLIKSSSTVISALTGVNGSYEFNDLDLSGGTRDLTLTSGLTGLWVSVENEDANETLHNFTVNSNGTHDWNWNESDSSYKNEESNAYYHVNKIHDFFKKFNFEGMDYQINVTVESGTNWCNAEYDPMNEKINLGGGNDGDCKNLALGSDVIYHEYTHGVVDHIFDYGGSSKCNLPIEAMDEAFADYFAATLNNDSRIAENILPTASVRNLNNTLTMDDLEGECHRDGRILSGALWKLRNNLGAELTDGLVFEAIRITPHAMNFSEFLENLLVADDDNADLWDGTPDKNEICGEFSSRKIYSFWCSDMRPDFTVNDLTFSPEDLTTEAFAVINATIKNTGNINLTLNGVNVSLFVDGFHEKSVSLNLTKISERKVNFTWDTVPGEHNITVIADPSNLINETNELNNEMTLNISIQNPDLSVERLSYSPTQPNSTSIVTITALIKNGGFNRDLDGVNVSLFVDNVLRNSTILNLTKISEKNVTFTWKAAGGVHNITVKIDPQNLINESNETNNELTINISVTQLSCVEEHGLTNETIIFYHYDYCPACNFMKPLVLDLENEGYVFHWAEVNDAEAMAVMDCYAPSTRNSYPRFICPAKLQMFIGAIPEETLKKFTQYCGQSPDSAVTNVYAPKYPNAGGNVTLTAEIRNLREFDLYNAPLEFLVDGAVIETRIINITGNSVKNESFNYVFEAGNRLITIRVNQYAKEFSKSDYGFDSTVVSYEFNKTNNERNKTLFVIPENTSFIDALSGGAQEKEFSLRNGTAQSAYVKLPKNVNVTYAGMNVTGFPYRVNLTVNEISAWKSSSASIQYFGSYCRAGDTYCFGYTNSNGRVRSKLIFNSTEVINLTVLNTHTLHSDYGSGLAWQYNLTICETNDSGAETAQCTGGNVILADGYDHSSFGMNVYDRQVMEYPYIIQPGRNYLAVWEPLNTNSEHAIARKLDSMYYAETTYPENVSVDVGDNSWIDWNHTGTFNTTERIEFTNELNEILKECTCKGCVSTQTACEIPVALLSDSDGIIELSDILILYKTPEKPDFSAEDLRYSPEKVFSGENITFNVKIKNNGNFNLNLSSIKVSFFIDNNLNNSVFMDLTNATEKEVNFTITADGYENYVHGIKITVDDSNLINESDESNNELEETLTIRNKCDLNHDGVIVTDWNDLMNAYKCSLGVERNCGEISYAECNKLKKEYDCFVGN